MPHQPCFINPTNCMNDLMELHFYFQKQMQEKAENKLFWIKQKQQHLLEDIPIRERNEYAHIIGQDIKTAQKIRDLYWKWLMSSSNEGNWDDTCKKVESLLKMTIITLHI